MKISKVEPIMLRYYPKHPPRDGLANIPYRDVLLVSIETDEGIAGIGEGFALGCLIVYGHSWKNVCSLCCLERIR